MISLTNIKRNEQLTIKFIRSMDNIDLSLFGLVQGQEIRIIESGADGVIIMVKNKRIALDAVTAESIIV